MLLTSPISLADQSVAERMREIARRMQSSPTLAEQAADEAVRVYRVTNDRSEAIKAGMEFLVEARADAPDARPELLPPQPASWVNSWPFLLIALAGAAAMYVGRAFGWIQ